MDIEDDDAFLYGDEPEQQPQSTAQVQAQAQAQAEAQAQAAKESAISASMAAYVLFSLPLFLPLLRAPVFFSTRITSPYHIHFLWLTFSILLEPIQIPSGIRYRRLCGRCRSSPRKSGRWWCRRRRWRR